MSTHHYVSMDRTHVLIYMATEMGPNTVPIRACRTNQGNNLNPSPKYRFSDTISKQMVYNSISCTIGIHPTRTSQSLPRAYQSRSKNTPNLTIHFQIKNPSIAIIILNLLLFAPIVPQQSVNPFESLTLRFWYIGRTKSGKIRSGSPLEIPPDRL